jgi:hypothetical protein
MKISIKDLSTDAISLVCYELSKKVNITFADCLEVISITPNQLTIRELA